MPGCSDKKRFRSERLPAKTQQRRWGQSSALRTPSSSLEIARQASSPIRSDLSVSFRPSASFSRSTPPSAARATFRNRASTSPPLQPASSSFLEASTTCPDVSTSSFLRSPPMSRATVVVPLPGPPCVMEKCSAGVIPTTRLRLPCTSMKFRTCRRASLASLRPMRLSSSSSRSKELASGAGDTWKDFKSSSACSCGISSTSDLSW
mmetsp:Transcript_77280/g.223614  ORF Transcript_77280/g.223614 Transcript_77280/m.223614 type:complete len:206 (+) Transcript_77280:475-1092(+)